MGWGGGTAVCNVSPDGEIERQKQKKKKKRKKHRIIFKFSRWQELVQSSTVTRTGIYLASPTKGEMELVVGRQWHLFENDLPEFEWVPSMDGITNPLQL